MTNPYVNRHCPFCGHVIDRAKIITHKTHNIIVCPDCKGGFLDSEAEPAKTDLYNEGYYNGENACSYPGYGKAERIIKSEFGRFYDYFRLHYDGSGKVLEIGSAYGFLLDIFRSGAVDIEGVETSDYARQIAVGKQHTVYRDVFNLPDDEKPKYDAVIMLDTIEHMGDINSQFKKLVQHVKDGSLLIITTGDYSSIAARVLGKRWRLFSPPYHIYYFTKAGMKKFLSRYGYTVTQVCYRWKLYPLRYLFTLPGCDRLIGAMGFLFNLFDVMTVVAVKRGNVSHNG